VPPAILPRAVTLSVIFAFPLAAEDWPQFRGIHRDGRSAERIAHDWPAEGPPVLWRTPVGDGYSGIAIVGGRAYTQWGDDDREWAGAFDGATGAKLWETRLGVYRADSQGGGPRSTPAVDGGRVFVLGALGRLDALDAATGKVLWTRDLRKDFGAKVPDWGISTSPLVEGGLVVTDVGGRRGYAHVAFDPASGNVRWHSGSDDPAYSSPIAVSLHGERQIVFLSASGLTGVEAGTGRRRWSAQWKTDFDVNAATPIFVPQSGFFVSSGYGVGSALFQVAKDGERFQAGELWRGTSMRNHFGTSVLLDYNVYGFDESIFTSIDVLNDGRRWQARGYGKGTLIAADGHLLVLGDRCVIGLVEATAKELREKARATVMTGRCWTAPSLADGVLYLRNQREMAGVRVSE
jgi:outer membrane protein assembly factor BamB